MKASESKWPFRPKHITNDGETCTVTDPTRQDIRNLTGVGIISNEHLQGIETAICTSLGNLTAIIEFSPEGERIRTDSPLLKSAKEPFGFHPPCTIFRVFTYDKRCTESDNVHAKLFYHLERGNLETKIKKRIAKCEYIAEYAKDKDVDFKFVTNRNRPYLEYDCPLLGYRELIFPVFFEGKVIALFLTGQICLRGKQEFIVERAKDFFKNHPSCLNKYSKNNPGLKPKRLKDRILTDHERWVNDRSHVLDEGKYIALIEKSFSGVDGLEETLVQQMRLQREHYIRRRIDLQIKEFRSNLPNEGAISEEKRARLWQNVEKRLRELVSDFAMRYVVVFGSSSFERERGSSLGVVAKAGDLPTKLEECIRSGQLRFNLNKVPNEIHHQWVTTAKEDRVFDALEGWRDYSEETNLIRVFPVPFFARASLAVLVGYYDWNPLMSVENKPRGQLDAVLQSFYTVVLSAFSSVLADAAEARREKAFGRLTHELKVPLVAIRGAAEFMMRTPGVDKLFDYDYPGDIRSWSELMGRLIDNADAFRHSVEGVQIKVTRTYLLRGVIAPAIRQVRLLLKERGFSFNNIECKSFDQIPKLWLDRNRFQQVFFNLLWNATKYAYSDTDAFRVEIGGEERGTAFVIWFRDWGAGIEPGTEEMIFQEGFRGKNALETNVTGQGLGLWVVRQIVERHGGTVEVTNLQLPTEFIISLPCSLTTQPPV